jgi:hypothetical protein
MALAALGAFGHGASISGIAFATLGASVTSSLPD